jgi:Asp-tRNA(Asn)/Glu-tRNA(Gln) amidotransferase A subunit family amidase
VKDIALGLDPVVGYDARDPASIRQDHPAYTSRLDANVKGLRVGVLRRFLDGVKPAVKKAFDDGLKVLASLGSEVVDLDIPEVSYAAMTSMMTSAAESAGNNRRWFREHYHDFVPHVSRGLAVGMTITASSTSPSSARDTESARRCEQPSKKWRLSLRRQPVESRSSCQKG